MKSLTKSMFAVIFLTFFSTLSRAAVLLDHQNADNTLFGASQFIPFEFASLNTPEKDSQQADVDTNLHGLTAVATVDRLANSVSSVKSTVLILARSLSSAYSVYSGLNGYGISYEVVTVPKTGFIMPNLNVSDSQGNYGAIFVVSDVRYDYGNGLGFQSAINIAQWNSIFNYQINFGVRLVRTDVSPGLEFGTTSSSGCCNDGVEQLISISDNNLFPTAGMKKNAGVSTKGLWHYPAIIDNNLIATEFAQFASSNSNPGTSTAGVINSFPGRQQMVWFIGFSTDWSGTSNFLQHASIHWATRGLYLGYRRINLNTQVDDLFLVSDIYSPAGNTFQIVPSDLEEHAYWAATVNAKLPTGSDWFIELGHNGNGNIEAASDINENICGVGPIEYKEQIDTPLEWAKPPGTGEDLWPILVADYPYSLECTNADALKVWFSNPENLNAFAHVSHTFTHEDQNNATYEDVFKEISWNRAWLNQVGIDSALRYSGQGIIPPAITGLHNHDAIKAWVDNGIVNVVGDNTRPVLMNQFNEMWPLLSTVESNGYTGITIVPRWATNIYYNCNLPECTVLEWINTGGGSGDFDSLMAVEKDTNIRHLLGLHHDPFMFHQANLDYGNAQELRVNGVTQKLSLFQVCMRVETITQELTRLVTWPIISLKHDDIAAAFIDRMTRDFCQPQLSWSVDSGANTITGITVMANNNTCTAEIPVTVPVNVTDTQGFRTEQIGSDPLTIWTNLSGSAVSFTFDTPIPI